MEEARFPGRASAPALLPDRGPDSSPLHWAVVSVLAEQMAHAVSLELAGNHINHMTGREPFQDALGDTAGER